MNAKAWVFTFGETLTIFGLLQLILMIGLEVQAEFVLSNYHTGVLSSGC